MNVYPIVLVYHSDSDNERKIFEDEYNMIFVHNKIDRNELDLIGAYN